MPTRVGRLSTAYECPTGNVSCCSREASCNHKPGKLIASPEAWADHTAISVTCQNTHPVPLGALGGGVAWLAVTLEAPKMEATT